MSRTSDGPGFAAFALRDAILVAATLALWGLESRGVGGVPVACAAGLGTAIAGFFVHEWGHLLGARLADGPASPPGRLSSVFLFHFDVGCATERQFLWMSYGGYAASVVSLAALVPVLPLDRLAGRVALGLMALGVLATFLLEIPTTVRVLRGRGLPQVGPAYVGGDAGAE